MTVLPVPAVGVTGDGLGCGMAKGSEASGGVRPAGSVAPVGQAAAQLSDAGGADHHGDDGHADPGDEQCEG
jgi:hypothetical protein